MLCKGYKIKPALCFSTLDEQGRYQVACNVIDEDVVSLLNSINQQLSKIRFINCWSTKVHSPWIVRLRHSDSFNYYSGKYVGNDAAML